VTDGSRTVLKKKKKKKKKVLGRFSTWNGFIFTKLKINTCNLS